MKLKSNCFDIIGTAKSLYHSAYYGRLWNIHFMSFDGVFDFSYCHDLIWPSFTNIYGHNLFLFISSCLGA